MCVFVCVRVFVCVCVCVCARACVRACVCKGDGRNTGNSRHYGNKLVLLVALKEHQSYLSLFFCLFTLCSTSVIALQIVFSNSSYESTAQ